MSKEQFISLELNLPNHSNELYKAEEYIEKIRNELNNLFLKKNINDKNHEEFYEQIARVLDYVGKLSEPVFETEYVLEDSYLLKFKNSPKLAKQLWLEHYGELHHPYNILKNRCFRMFEELDEEYILVHKKNPPNFNI